MLPILAQHEHQVFASMLLFSLDFFAVDDDVSSVVAVAIIAYLLL